MKRGLKKASSLVLRVSTSEGPEENKEPTANLIIISHLFRELMWCLRCQAALSLSLSFILASFFPHLSISIPLPRSLTSILSFLFALCHGSALTLGALMKSFQGRMWRSEMSFSDQMSLKQGLSYHLVRSTSFRFTSAFTNTIAQWNHLWLLGFSPTYVLQRKLYSTLERKQCYSSGGYIDSLYSDIHLIVQEFTKDHTSKVALTGQRLCCL